MQVTLNETQVTILNSVLKEAIEINHQKQNKLLAELLTDIQKKIDDGKC